MLTRARPNRNPARRREHGFSVMEVILMIVVIATVALPLSRLAVVNNKGVAQYALTTKALYDAQSIMERILADYGNPDRGYDYILANYDGVSVSTNSGLFSGGVSLSAENTLDGLHYTEVTVTVSGGGMQGDIQMKTWVAG